MKKPAAKKSGASLAAASGAANLAQAVANKKAAAKKPAAKKPAPGKKGAAGKKPPTAHQAHLAHLKHLQHLGLLPKAAPKPARRMLALGNGVACCAAEAVAASLRLTGRRVDDADVLALYRRTADDPDTGATILATLEAASEFGLRGVRPVGFGAIKEQDLQTLLQAGGCGHPAADPVPPSMVAPALILGVDLPGPHAVLDDGSSWWSWGEPYDLATWPDAVTEEAWTLTWP